MKRRFREPVIAYLILCAVNYLFFRDDPAFISFRFHPYLFLTVLFAARYGIWEGALSGVIGAGLALWAILGQSDFWETELLYGLQKLGLPFALVILGVLVGENVESIKNKLEYFRSTLQREVVNSRRVMEASKGLEVSLLDIEKKFAGHSLGIGDFSGSLLEMFGRDRMDIYRHMQEMFKRFLSVDKSLVLVSNPDINNQVQMPSDGKRYHQEEIEGFRHNPLVEEVLRQGRVVTLTGQGDDILQGIKKAHAIYYAGPVFRSDNHIDAIVLIVQMPFIQFNMTNFRLFKTILDSASKAVSQREGYLKLYRMAPYHHLWPVERDHYFMKNLNFIMQIHDKIDVTVIGFQYSESANDRFKQGMMLLLSQLCVYADVRVGYIERSSCFAVYKEMSDGQDLGAKIAARYQAYGIGEDQARLVHSSVVVTGVHTRREDEHVLNMLDRAFRSLVPVS